MSFNPLGELLMVGEDQICADSNQHNPVVSLDYKDLGHPSVEVAEHVLFWESEAMTGKIHTTRG
jgi:hypothetical protein